MLIDEITLKITAGKGGDGRALFSKMPGIFGPTGGSGGNGGNVYMEGVSDLSALNQFRFVKEVAAHNGQDGKIERNDGGRGEDLILKVPIGSIAYKLTTEETREIVSVGERALLARGGKGGKGNFLFRSSTNTSPKEFGVGTPGEVFDVRIELKLIADVGFVGLPNAGKSSLLNELTNARSKVANYQFTTLEPNLGVYNKELILADIPGLIEGASTGKGLGVKFLRHIERTRILFHLISTESEDVARDYKTIRKELGTYNEKLLDKQEYLLISKSDTADKVSLKKILTKAKKLNPSVVVFSIHDHESMEGIKKILHKIAQEKSVKES
ncbi:hypothetical protein A3C91_00425 [Candidatus Azambacteria bacterium RIFCSPHIGHO2_02_FULL_52_12]|uniref:GTPase Obg n=1 Tax=Candidatus Azambacteria bacterium RIFCSPLOWO2_01_FULL_46_25 TaxID=1797298 RepID=A0A1F5BTN1_9BACT|nr:MAG: hypothetical protein A3C91_00425 [Candidatus Azambacteria bacterium RIFCSPHIGHO2_02_FULL_52_12]OGD33977.1 MAG: hypothetical protein A2988_00625 [Candidatus Azambacteria bacterium RIFCSPLOWO2_01_FULL_46_25]OGD37663.1 MAG: hypothetical protein A2850_04700 [Candidatus Azambacteria bacterium RIFCSPHIGHO2_01_FULL_51_74]